MGEAGCLLGRRGPVCRGPGCTGRVARSWRGAGLRRQSRHHDYALPDQTSLRHSLIKQTQISQAAGSSVCAASYSLRTLHMTIHIPPVEWHLNSLGSCRHPRGQTSFNSCTQHRGLHRCWSRNRRRCSVGRSTGPRWCLREAHQHASHISPSMQPEQARAHGRACAETILQLQQGCLSRAASPLRKLLLQGDYLAFMR